MKKYLALILCLVVVSSLFLVGCAKKQKQEETIKIGAILPLTGPGALSGEYYKNSAELAVEEVNAAGGINGKKVELVVEDGETDPQKSSTAATYLVNLHNISVFVTGFRGPSLAISSVVSANKKFLIGNTGIASEKEKLGNEYFFPIGADVLMAAKLLAEYAKNKGCNKAIYIRENMDLQAWWEEKMKEVYEDNLKTDMIQIGEKDFKSIVTKIKENKPECLLVTIQSTSFLNFLEELERQNMHLPIYTSSYAINPTLIEKAPLSQLEKITYTTEGFYENEKNKFFFDKYREKYQKEPHVFGATMYDALNILFKSMKTCDKIAKAEEPKCLKEEILKMKKCEGIVGEYFITEKYEIVLRNFAVWKIDKDRKNVFIEEIRG